MDVVISRVLVLLSLSGEAHLFFDHRIRIFKWCALLWRKKSRNGYFGAFRGYIFRIMEEVPVRLSISLSMIQMTFTWSLFSFKHDRSVLFCYSRSTSADAPSKRTLKCDRSVLFFHSRLRSSQQGLWEKRCLVRLYVDPYRFDPNDAPRGRNGSGTNHTQILHTSPMWGVTLELVFVLSMTTMRAVTTIPRQDLRNCQNKCNSLRQEMQHQFLQ